MLDSIREICADVMGELWEFLYGLLNGLFQFDRARILFDPLQAVVRLSFTVKCENKLASWNI